MQLKTEKSKEKSAQKVPPNSDWMPNHNTGEIV